MFLFGLLWVRRSSLKKRGLEFQAQQSSTSIWEIAIKVKLGKLKVDLKQMVDAIAESGFSELPITA